LGIGQYRRYILGGIYSDNIPYTAFRGYIITC
jgi:hypothetical protein